MMEMSRAARKTEAHSESMMMVVCSFVLAASGSAGGAFCAFCAAGAAAGGACFSSLASRLVEPGVWSSRAMIHFVRPCVYRRNRWLARFRASLYNPIIYNNYVPLPVAAPRVEWWRQRAAKGLLSPGIMLPMQLSTRLLSYLACSCFCFAFAFDAMEVPFPSSGNFLPPYALRR